MRLDADSSSHYYCCLFVYFFSISPLRLNAESSSRPRTPSPPQRGRRGSCKAYLHYVSELQPHLHYVSESKVALAPPPLLKGGEGAGGGMVHSATAAKRIKDKRKRLITFVYLSVPSCHFVSLVCQFTVFCSLAQCLILNK